MGTDSKRERERDIMNVKRDFQSNSDSLLLKAALSVAPLSIEINNQKDGIVTVTENVPNHSQTNYYMEMIAGAVIVFAIFQMMKLTEAVISKTPRPSESQALSKTQVLI